MWHFRCVKLENEIMFFLGFWGSFVSPWFWKRMEMFVRCVNFGGAKPSVESSIDRYGPFSRSLTARCSVVLLDVLSAVQDLFNPWNVGVVPLYFLICTLYMLYPSGTLKRRNLRRNWGILLLCQRWPDCSRRKRSWQASLQALCADSSRLWWSYYPTWCYYVKYCDMLLMLHTESWLAKHLFNLREQHLKAIQKFSSQDTLHRGPLTSNADGGMTTERCVAQGSMKKAWNSNFANVQCSWFLKCQSNIRRLTYFRLDVISGLMYVLGANITSPLKGGGGHSFCFSNKSRIALVPRDM